MKFVKNIAVALCVTAGLASAANAAGAGKHPKQVEWKFNGVFGDFDYQSAQRGFQIYKEVCSACHSLKYFRFRNLDKLGYNEDQIKAIAAEYEVDGDIDDAGDETVRAALPQDAFPSPFRNDNAAASANGGAIPPDLSLMVKARHDGANYVYSLLTGYEDESAAPEGINVSAGKYYNPYFKGSVISMAPPLSEGIVEYAEGNPEANLDQMSKDLVNFLMYTAEPNLHDRHKMGVMVIIFLSVLTILLYFSMKKIWRPVKEGKNFYEDAE
ncbi:cytochrome c1 [Kordiimonas sp. SCSIO 12610]|uniref:cytochrome c1 n=1 Tax=Kordiimonas sp. SCSIO 12610 TaxID=2829597 RepID=UPI00210AC23C|nr:cytochrome c1 [Kordiimonas sp. SCSIO 12610]UTW54452.1 cytochrome c1 [Kordiimonas sp. SCSIO 12610]